MRVRLGWLFFAAVVVSRAQDLKEMEKRVTEFTLSNGLRFILLERHEAPLISFQTYVAAGSVNDPAGQTGLAKIMERMAIKGTETIGTRNWPEEKKALDAMDEAYDRMEAERNKGPRMNQSQYETLRTQWRLAVDQTLRHSQSGDYLRLLDENGATGFHSQTGFSSIQFSYTLPSNRIELWFAMESQRLIHPVFREFYTERDDLVEELRKRPTNFQTRLFDIFLAAAFVAQPYRVTPLGWATDLAELRRTDARAFYEKYFIPGNITMALVGDVNPEDARKLAEKYFGPMPARPMPPPIRTVDPPQPGPRTAGLDLAVQTMAIIGYKRPDFYDKDDTALDILQAVLVSDTGGLAYRELVQERRIALALQAGATYPDGRYPNAFLFFLAPTQGHTIEENQKALEEVLTRLKTQKVGPELLEQAKARVRALSYQRLQTNPTTAEMLALYTSAYGDWKKLFTLIEDVRSISEDDLIRVAQRYFYPANRTTAYIAAPRIAAAPADTGGRP
jgi:predicted Zn-dependent peptidase